MCIAMYLHVHHIQYPTQHYAAAMERQETRRLHVVCGVCAPLATQMRAQLIGRVYSLPRITHYSLTHSTQTTLATNRKLSKTHVDYDLMHTASSILLH